MSTGSKDVLGDVVKGGLFFILQDASVVPSPDQKSDNWFELQKRLIREVAMADDPDAQGEPDILKTSQKSPKIKKFKTFPIFKIFNFCWKKSAKNHRKQPKNILQARRT